MVTVSSTFVPAPSEASQQDEPASGTQPHHGGPAAPHGHQASLKDGLAFVNTLESDRGQVNEHLPTLDAALVWLFEHELLHRQMREELLARLADDPAAQDRVLRRIA